MWVQEGMFYVFCMRFASSNLTLQALGLLYERMIGLQESVLSSEHMVTEALQQCLDMKKEAEEAAAGTAEATEEAAKHNTVTLMLTLA